MSPLESLVSFWDALAFWLTVAGATLLFFGGVSSVAFRRYNRQLLGVRAVQDQRERDATAKSLAETNSRAAEANERAKEAEARAAEANLELEKLRTPRTLAPEQKKRLIAALKPFADTWIELFSYPGNDEARRLRDQIAEVLKEAGWHSERPGTPHLTPEAMVPADGILIEVAPHAEAREREAADVLAEALRAENLAVTGSVRMMNLGLKVRLTVGHKP